MIEQPTTITCCCTSPNCGMTLTVLPVAGSFKLTMTPRKDMLDSEPAIEWVTPDKLQRRLEAAGCAFFGVFRVYHYLDSDLDLDMQITEQDRLQLLAIAKGDHGTHHQEGQGTSTLAQYPGLPPAEPDAAAAGNSEVLQRGGSVVNDRGLL